MLGQATVFSVPYTEEGVAHVAELGRDPNRWRPAEPEAWEHSRRRADAIADS